MDMGGSWGICSDVAHEKYLGMFLTGTRYLDERDRVDKVCNKVKGKREVLSAPLTNSGIEICDVGG